MPPAEDEQPAPVESPADVSILVVCAADQARSPVTAHLLSTEAVRRGLDRRVRVSSAGLSAGEWRGLRSEMADALAARGLDVKGHRARPLDVDEVGDSRLIVTLTEEQRRAVGRLDPAAVGRCFTLREIVRLVSSPAWRPEWNGNWDADGTVVQHLHAVRSLVPARGGPEDVADPAPGGRRRARTVLSEITAAVNRIATPLFGEPAP